APSLLSCPSPAAAKSCFSFSRSPSLLIAPLSSSKLPLSCCRYILLHASRPASLSSLCHHPV
ncbi:unnamed protein product, partial [Closterium sp. Naga37s-1]